MATSDVHSTAAPTTPSRPLILQPQAVPVIGRDAHLPAVAETCLTPEALRRRLNRLATGELFIAGDLEVAATPAATAVSAPVSAPAAVLIGLVPRAHGLSVLLTRRTEHLKHHAGQISFPGGRQEPEDADEIAAALREAQEEIGLPPEQVEVIGRLPEYRTITRFVVTPVVALVQAEHLLQLDAFEVAEAFEVPLSFLMNPAHHQRHRFSQDGAEREFLSMPWLSPEGREYFIWGATAGMLRNLYHMLSA